MKEIEKEKEKNKKIIESLFSYLSSWKEGEERKILPNEDIQKLTQLIKPYKTKLQVLQEFIMFQNRFQN